MNKLVLFAAALLVSPARAWAASGSEAHRLYFRGEPEKALILYQSLLENQPSIATALNAATVAEELGRHRLAIAIMERSLRANPESLLLQAELASAYLNLGDMDNAARYFSLIESTKPARVRDMIGRGVLEFERGGTIEARDWFQRAREARPFLTLASYYLGQVSEREGKLDDAIPAYEAAISKDSHFIEVRPLLAALFELRGQTDEAWRQNVRIFYADGANTKASSEMERLAPRLVKRPEEILRSVSISGHTVVSAVPPGPLRVIVRVGIGTSDAGRPVPTKTIAFRTSRPFSLLDGKTKQEIACGGAKERWIIEVSTNGRSARVIAPAGEAAASFRGSAVLTQQDKETATTIVGGLLFAAGTPWGGMTDRELRGDLEIMMEPKRKSLVLINHVNLEAYLCGVVAAEMPVRWPIEALKCQAVLARNIGLVRCRSLHLHKRFNYDVCDGQHCQVYSGVSAESEKVRTAVQETAGKVLLFNGKPAHTVFASNCGGRTQSGGQAGWGNVEYWQPRDDAKDPADSPRSPWEMKVWLREMPRLYCEASSHVWFPEYRWTRMVLAETIAAKLSRRKRNIGRLRQIYVLKRNRSGHVQKLQAVGTKGSVTLTREYEIRRLLGLGSLRSTQFVVDTVVRDAKAKSFIFYGGGWGHGVGFCQSGAAGRAEAGLGYKEILLHYFPGTTLE